MFFFLLLAPQEFLKKEFSAENILFWVSCERFRRSAASASASASPEELHAGAIAILDRHLAQGAPDPVNVDSHARQAAQVANGSPTTTDAKKKKKIEAQSESMH